MELLVPVQLEGELNVAEQLDGGLNEAEQLDVAQDMNRSEFTRRSCEFSLFSDLPGE